MRASLLQVTRDRRCQSYLFNRAPSHAFLYSAVTLAAAIHHCPIRASPLGHLSALRTYLPAHLPRILLLHYTHQHHLTSPTSPHLPFRCPIALPSYHPNPTHESSAPRRQLDGGVAPAADGRGGGQACPWQRGALGVLAAERSWLLLAQTASARRSLQPASSGRASSPWSTLPGHPPWRRSPVGVQHAVSTHPGSSGSGRPVSGRPVSGHLPRRNLDSGLAGGRLSRSGTVRISSYFRTL